MIDDANSDLAVNQPDQQAQKRKEPEEEAGSSGLRSRLFTEPDWLRLMCSSTHTVSVTFP